VIDFTAILIGCGLGLFAGLVPGLGYFMTLLLAFPLLLDMTVIQLLIVYSAVVTVSIYVGSVPATIYGIPGDTASMPVVYESRNLKDLKQVSQAISGAAFGGFFGSVSVAVFCLLMIDHLDSIKYFYSTLLVLLLLVLASVIIIWTAGNKKSISFLLYVAGFLLGMIGYNGSLDMSIFVINDYMYQGLPREVVLATLFALPNMVFYFNYFKTNSKSRSKESYSVWSVYFVNPINSAFFSALGFVTGLMPGLTTIFSSMASYNIMSYFTKDPVKRIVASETGNNAGAFSCILPLLIFGIPISGSEALLLYFMEQNGFTSSEAELGPLMRNLVANFMIINLVGLALAWPLSNYVKYFYRLDLRYVFGSVLVVIFCSVMYSAWTSNSMLYYLSVILVLAPIGIALRNYYMLPLIFAYLISDKAIGSLVILKQLYF